MNDNKEFKPYIPAEKITPEFTVTSIIMGIILAVVFGAANAYLGLRVGMTVSASIPAAVISMGVIRVIMKKNSILESNIVQTIGSAGESLQPVHLHHACIIPVGRRRLMRYAEPCGDHSDRTLRRRSRRTVHGTLT